MRGPGGGKVRTRPQRKAARRRKQGLADYLLLGLLGGTLVFVVEHFALRLAWGWAAIAGLTVAIATVAWSKFLDRRRAARAAAAEPKRVKRR